MLHILAIFDHFLRGSGVQSAKFRLFGRILPPRRYITGVNALTRRDTHEIEAVGMIKPAINSEEGISIEQCSKP